MNKRRLAICDKDRDYLTMLQAYLSKKNPAGFEVVVYESVRQAVLDSKEERFEILLVGEGIYDTDVINVEAQKVFILQEDGLAGITGYSVVPKYQSMERLIRQVLDAFALDEECTTVPSKGQMPTRLVSFYAPDRHRGQCVAALAAAQVLTELGHKVLYISMQPFSGFEELLGVKYDSDMTDFMYFVLNHSDKLAYKLEGIKRTIHGVDYLPPALDYSDLVHITQEEWKQCFDVLLYSGNYSDIVVDLTECCDGFYSFLERSDAVYLLSERDAFSKAMYAQFEQLMKLKELDTVVEKSVRFNLPAGWEGAALDLGQLSISPLGAYMKGILGQNGQQ